jgi:hypothetical protein
MTIDEAKAEARQALLALGREASPDAITLAAIILTLGRLAPDEAGVLRILGLVEALGGDIRFRLEENLEAMVALANHVESQTAQRRDDQP